MRIRLVLGLVAILCSLGIAVTAWAADGAVEGAVDSFLGEPRFELQQVFANERFPNVVVTTQGTVLATWGSGHVRAGAPLRHLGDAGPPNPRRTPVHRSGCWRRR